MDAELDPLPPPLASSNERSGLAVAAAGFSVLCPIGVGGLLGVVLGWLALRQISAGLASRESAGIAWLGILAGVVQLLAIAVAWTHVWNNVSETRAPVAAFMRGLSERDPAAVGESCSNGLKPLLERGAAALLVDRLDETVGSFESAGERSSAFEVSLEGTQLVYTVQYPLKFESGAPVIGTFALVKEGGAMRLLGFRLESPLLRPRIELGARNSAEIAEYEGPRNVRPKNQLREFRR